MENKQKLLDVPFPTEIVTAGHLDDRCEEIRALIDEKIEEVKELIPSGSADPTKIDEIKDLIQDNVIPAIAEVDEKIGAAETGIEGVVNSRSNAIDAAIDEIKSAVNEMSDIIKLGGGVGSDDLDLTLPKMPMVVD